jgi:hypothetical protein
MLVVVSACARRPVSPGSVDEEVVPAASVGAGSEATGDVVVSAPGDDRDAASVEPDADGAPGAAVPAADAAPSPEEPLRFDDIRDLPAPERTEDGIPILRVLPEASASTGGVFWISEAWNTLHYAQLHASDGVGTFFAVTKRYQDYSDVLVRGGRIHTDVLRRIGGTPEHLGGCGAAAAGILLLSAPPVEDRRGGSAQRVWIVGPDGAVREDALPPFAGTDGDCKAVLDPDGAFAVVPSRVAAWDGTEYRVDDVWSSPRVRMAGARGPWYCFDYCNAGETEHNDPAVAVIKQALGGCSAEYAVLGEWLAGRCSRGGKAARMRRGGRPEVTTGLPEPTQSMADDIVLTAEGDVVVELELGFDRYAVWSADGRVSPVRTLAPDELLAKSSPTILLRGLPRGVPEAVVYAVVLGRELAFGASGSTYGYAGIRRSAEAHAAQVERAREVLPRSDRLVVAHEAVIDLACGAYVRSPIGWEGEMIEDWIPPVLPELHAAAVHRPRECLPLESAAAVPGDPDLLLGRTPDGKLAVAWLPPPLPLPAGISHFHDGPQGDTTPPVQHPRPGSGWTVLGPVDRIEGITGVPAPGADTDIGEHSWQAGGAALLRVGDADLLLTSHAVMAIPRDTVPMSVRLYAPGAFGALGPRLVACAERCRVLEPGPSWRIDAVVPRTERAVVLGYEGGRAGLFELPADGGTPVPEPPLAAALRDFLRTRPAE